MTTLEADTIFYRADHRDGFMFGEGNPAPSPVDGWVTSPDEIAEAAPVTYECTTLAAFAELLRTERVSGIAVQGQRDAALRVNRELSAQVQALETAVADLKSELAHQALATSAPA